MSTTEAQKRARKKYYEKNKQKQIEKTADYNKINFKRICVNTKTHEQLKEFAQDYNISIPQLISKLIIYCKKIKDVVSI